MMKIKVWDIAGVRRANIIVLIVSVLSFIIVGALLGWCYWASSAHGTDLGFPIVFYYCLLAFDAVLIVLALAYFDWRFLPRLRHGGQLRRFAFVRLEPSSGLAHYRLLVSDENGHEYQTIGFPSFRDYGKCRSGDAILVYLTEKGEAFLIDLAAPEYR